MNMCHLLAKVLSVHSKHVHLKSRSSKLAVKCKNHFSFFSLQKPKPPLRTSSFPSHKPMKQFKSDQMYGILLLWHLLFLGSVKGQGVTFYVTNKCPFPIWPATASNAGYPVIAQGGFLLPPGQTKRVEAPPSWSGRFWARTSCGNFNSTSKPACETGDCDGLLACNGAIGRPPATLVQVSLQADKGKPSFYDVSLVDGYNLPVAMWPKPHQPSSCTIGGCLQSLNSMCPRELQVYNGDGDVVACKSACLAFDLDVFCCRNEYGTPEKCKPSMYSKMFKDVCPSYFSYAYDSPPPMLNCFSKEYVITFCPNKWGAQLDM